MDKPSLISLCNEALLLVNKAEISDLFSTDQSMAAKACKLLLPRTLMAIFSSYPWMFATTYLLVDPTVDHQNDSDDPDWNYRKKYPYRYEWLLPEDCARFITAFREDWIPIRASQAEQASPVAYASSSKVLDSKSSSSSIWSNYSAIAYSYVRYNEDPEHWPAYFCDAVVLDLALRLSKYFVDSLQYTSMLLPQLRNQLEMAKAEDAQQQYFSSYRPFPLKAMTRSF
ncbi:MAG: hypothetical protein LBG20_04470 [Holosporaceae bacterium]|jgi:hypothetical protein|nr:hypothetical protein [Holosporaceae bacterium]